MLSYRTSYRTGSNRTVKSKMENTSTNQDDFTSGIILQPGITLTVEILNYFIFLVIVIGNSLTIASIVRFRRLRTNTNILICSLSIADLYVGILTFVYHLSFTTNLVTEHMFVVIYSLLNIGYQSSVFHLAAISVERFVGVNKPLRYHSIITLGRIKMFIVGSWAVAASFGLLCIVILIQYGFDLYIYIDLICISFYFTAGFVIGVSYLAILPSVIRQAKAVREQSPAEETHMRREIKASVTLGIVMLAYIICWIPNFIITVCMYTSSVTPLVYTLWLFSLLFCTTNSALNCFLYAWRSRDFRRAYLTLLTCGKKGENRIFSIN